MKTGQEGKQGIATVCCQKTPCHATRKGYLAGICQSAGCDVGFSWEISLGAWLHAATTGCGF
jgi:hypothetical protein